MRTRRCPVAELVILIISMALAAVSVALATSCTTPHETPAIDLFVAEPKQVEIGNSTTLHWRVQRTDRIFLEPGHRDVSRQTSVEVWPDRSVTYTLYATNSRGWAAATIEVPVYAK